MDNSESETLSSSAQQNQYSDQVDSLNNFQNSNSPPSESQSLSKSSDQSPSSHSDTQSNNISSLSREEILDKLAKQMSYYFSDANIFRDAHLRDIILSDEEESIPISEFLKFQKLKQFNTDEDTLIEALKLSPDLSVDLEQKTAGLPPDYSYPQLQELIISEVGITPISLIFRRNKANNFRGSAYVQLETMEDHQKLLQYSNKIHVSADQSDDPLHIESQERYYSNRPDKGRSRGALRYRDFARALAARKGCLLEVKHIGTASREQIRNKFEKLGSTVDVEISKTGRSASVQFLDPKEVDYIMETYSKDAPFILDGQEIEFIRVTQHRVRPWTKTDHNQMSNSRDQRGSRRFSNRRNFRDRRSNNRDHYNHRSTPSPRDSRRYNNSPNRGNRGRTNHYSNNRSQNQNQRRYRNGSSSYNSNYSHSPSPSRDRSYSSPNHSHSSHNSPMNRHNESPRHNEPPRASRSRRVENSYSPARHTPQNNEYYSPPREAVRPTHHEVAAPVYDGYAQPAYYEEYQQQPPTPSNMEIHASSHMYESSPVRQKRPRDRHQAYQDSDQNRKYYANEGYDQHQEYYQESYSSQPQENGYYTTYN